MEGIPNQQKLDVYWHERKWAMRDFRMVEIPGCMKETEAEDERLVMSHVLP